MHTQENMQLITASQPCGDATVVKGLNLRFLESQGVAILAFYDSRHLARAELHVCSQTFFGNRRLTARKISAGELRRVIDSYLLCLSMGSHNFLHAFSTPGNRASWTRLRARFLSPPKAARSIPVPCSMSSAPLVTFVYSRLCICQIPR